MAGDILLTGLIEMRSDNIERNIQPRPGVSRPSKMSAAVAHDRQISGAGITTVFDAVAVGSLGNQVFVSRFSANQSKCSAQQIHREILKSITLFTCAAKSAIWSILEREGRTDAVKNLEKGVVEG